MSNLQLQQLIAGMGVSDIRNLHVRDTDHANSIEYDMLLDNREILQALVAGRYTNIFPEGDIRRNQPIPESNIFHPYFPDVRYAHYDATVARFPQHAAIHRQYGDQIAMMAQVFGYGPPDAQEIQAVWARDFAADIAARRIPATVPPGFVEAYRDLGPALFADMLSVPYNQETIANIQRQAARRPDANNLIIYGSSHTDNGGILNSADLDTALPGYNLVILNSPSRRSSDGRLERDVAMRGTDHPEFIYYLDPQGGPQLEDLRSAEEKTRLPLATLLSRGGAALGSTPVPTVPARTAPPPAPPAPVDAAPSEPAAPQTPVIPEPEPEADPEVTIPGTGGDTNFFSAENLRNLPFGSIIGGVIGAWLASGMGNGIGRMIVMALGGLIGWMIGGNFGSNLRRDDDNQGVAASAGAEAPAPAQTPPTPTPAVQSSLGQNQVPTATLAFANVSSVRATAAYPTAEVPNGELPDAQNLVLPPVMETPTRATVIH